MLHWHHAAYLLLAGTQKKNVLHFTSVTSVCVPVDSLAPRSPRATGRHTGWRGLDVAGPYVEQDEDVPVPWSPFIVWKDLGQW